MYGIEILVEEHRHILRFAEILEAECLEIFNGKDGDPKFFHDAIAFIREFADKHHHQKEEEILFKAMLEELGPVAEKLIRHGMLVEHDLARFQVMSLENAVNHYEETGNRDDLLPVIGFAMGYVDLIGRHAGKENDVLYPYGEKHLAEETKKRIDEETKSLEEKRKEEGFSQGVTRFLSR